MAKPTKNAGPEARLPKGFRDTPPDELRETGRMLATIRRVYESYGFEPLETPAIEYTDALGKFLPDQDRPNEGVFSFQDEDEQWLSLRYDLTAPLARYVAENFERLPKPFRRYAVGPVWRNEKPGPGRFRQFTQFDADTVGTDNIAADAEICMLAADTMEALGITRGDYVIKVNSRKILEGIREVIGIESDQQWLTSLRAIDKADRLGLAEISKLLTVGRTDVSGDKTAGAGLTQTQAKKIIAAIDTLVSVLGLEPGQSKQVRQELGSTLARIDKISPTANAAIITAVAKFAGSGSPANAATMFSEAGGLAAEEAADIAKNEHAWKIYRYLGTRYYDDSLAVLEKAEAVGEKGSTRYPWGERSFPSDAMTLSAWRDEVGNSEIGKSGADELERLIGLVRAAGYGPGRIVLDPSVVRGLEYYTGPVFEAEITVPVVNEDGQTVRFGSVGGGGRYDGLIERFTGQKVPATGFSIGVSRLQAALAALNKDKPAPADGPVVVLVMDKAELPRFQRMAQSLRAAGIRAEMYLGTAGMKAQMKYADKRGAPCVVIQGGDERNAPDGPMVQIKDLVEGAKAAATIKDSKEWREGRPAQVSVPEADLVAAVRDLLARHRG